MPIYVFLSSDMSIYISQSSNSLPIVFYFWYKKQQKYSLTTTIILKGPDILCKTSQNSRYRMYIVIKSCGIQIKIRKNRLLFWFKSNTSVIFKWHSSCNVQWSSVNMFTFEWKSYQRSQGQPHIRSGWSQLGQVRDFLRSVYNTFWLGESKCT